MKMQEGNNYVIEVQQIKKAILRSRYEAAALANAELLKLYFGIGQYVSFHSRNKNWGKGAIDSISSLLQQELHGLRGFSATNIKNMRLFYEGWEFMQPFLIDEKEPLFQFSEEELNRQLPSAELKNQNRQLATGDLNNSFVIRQLPTDELQNEFNTMFLKIGFTHHIAIINNTEGIEERVFYIQKTATEFWNNTTLKHHLKSDLYQRQGKLAHNFQSTLSENAFRQKALMAFKDEMLLDFINIEDADEEPNERVLENAIVQNIKKFIMALGSEFSFIGNQHRLLIEDEEYFIDLLFFNRKIQSLVAIELKKGKFKAEYVGKMNLYLSALDEMVKQPHENPSIGIILCKEKNNKIVEFAFRDTSKPMGVVTYKTYNDLPEAYRNILPDTETLKSLL
ncbi:YhcG family protein [Flavobacterium sp. LM5]|uniref:PDDEXK nuclease domain-containing protein n=1 Tax=Flavobacterium sp. LM5 TaxID=1938610 RepID=UPI001CB8A2B0|nr:PDDEXK nuclease domain-containing protein [Flavobacterium sp. LM5]